MTSFPEFASLIMLFENAKNVLLGHRKKVLCVTLITNLKSIPDLNLKVSTRKGFFSILVVNVA